MERCTMILSWLFCCLHRESDIRLQPSIKNVCNNTNRAVASPGIGTYLLQRLSRLPNKLGRFIQVTFPLISLLPSHSAPQLHVGHLSEHVDPRPTSTGCVFDWLPAGEKRLLRPGSGAVELANGDELGSVVFVHYRPFGSTSPSVRSSSRCTASWPLVSVMWSPLITVVRRPGWALSRCLFTAC